MTQATNAADGRTIGRGAAPREVAALLGVEAVAQMLSCSVRHVYRLSDAGRMPRPVKVGTCVRWRRDELRQWINEGCPDWRRRGQR